MKSKPKTFTFSVRHHTPTGTKTKKQSNKSLALHRNHDPLATTPSAEAHHEDQNIKSASTLCNGVDGGTPTHLGRLNTRLDRIKEILDDLMVRGQSTSHDGPHNLAVQECITSEAPGHSVIPASEPWTWDLVLCDIQDGTYIDDFVPSDFTLPQALIFDPREVEWQGWDTSLDQEDHAAGVEWWTGNTTDQFEVDSGKWLEFDTMFSPTILI